MSSSYNVLHDWWIWVIIIGVIVGTILIVAYIVLEYPGLCECLSLKRKQSDLERGEDEEDNERKSFREKSSNFVRKMSRHGRNGRQNPRKEANEDDKVRHSFREKSSNFARKMSGHGKHGRQNPRKEMEDEIEVKNSFREKSSNFVRKMSGRGKHGRQIPRSPVIERKKRNTDQNRSSLRNSFKASREFVRKLSRRGVNNDQIPRHNYLDNEDVEQPVIKITQTSARGSFKVSSDIFNKLSRGNARRNDDINNDEKSRKVGVCVVDYYPPIKEYANEEDDSSLKENGTGNNRGLLRQEEFDDHDNCERSEV